MSYCSPVIGPDGVIHPSQAAACRAHGISKTTIRYHLNRHGNLSRFGSGNSRPGIQNAAKPVTIGAMKWPSREKAAEDLGISPHQLKRWISPKATPAMLEMLTSAVMRRLARDDLTAYRERGENDDPKKIAAAKLSRKQ